MQATKQQYSSSSVQAGRGPPREDAAGRSRISHAEGEIREHLHTQERVEADATASSAAHRILKNATCFFNLTQHLRIDASYDDKGYFNAESIDRFLGDMLKPTVVSIYRCAHPSINDAFVRDVLLAKYSGTVEEVRFVDCAHITAAAYVAMLRAPASYKLRCETCVVIADMVADYDDRGSYAKYTPDMFRACIEMIDERADTSGELCAAACFITQKRSSRKHVHEVTARTTSVGCCWH